MIKSITGKNIEPGNVILYYAGDCPLKDNYFYLVVKIVQSSPSFTFCVLTKKGTFVNFYAKPNDEYGLLF